MRKRIISLLVLFFFVFNNFYLNNYLYAGWLNDWLNNVRIENPESVKSQERMFLSAGSFSFRNKLKTDHLFSIEAPRLNIGCGGIDIFFGSFAYLNPEYLIEKAKRIIQAAPYFAFQLALSVLCEECSKIMAQIQAVIDFINNLQLNECKASQAIVTMGVEALKNPSQFVETVKSNIRSGFDNLWNDAAKQANNQGAKDWKSLFTEAFGGTPGIGGKIADCLKNKDKCYLMDIYYDTYSDAGDIIEKSILRAYFGDILIMADNTTMKAVHYLPPCATDGLEPDQLIYTKLQYATITNDTGNQSGTLRCQNVSDSTIYDYVKNKMDSIVNVYIDYKNKSMTDNDRYFVNSIDVPVVAVFRSILLLHNIKVMGTGVYAGMIRDAGLKATEAVAYSYALKIINGINSISLGVYNKLLEASQSSGNKKDKASLNVEEILPKLKSLKDDWDALYSDAVTSLRAEYDKSLQKFQPFMENVELANALIPELINSIFGKSVVTYSKV